MAHKNEIPWKSLEFPLAYKCLENDAQKGNKQIWDGGTWQAIKF